MKKLFCVWMLVLAMAIPAFAEDHVYQEPELVFHGPLGEDRAETEMEVDATIAALSIYKTHINWANFYNLSYGYQWFTYEFYSTSSFDCCTQANVYFTIGKEGYYTIKTTMFEKNSGGVWVPADEGWPGWSTDPMMYSTGKVLFTPGYYSLSYHFHFENPGMKRVVTKIIQGGVVKSTFTGYIDVY
jgi:hypothetical protein